MSCCREEQIWKKLFDRPLFPVLCYGSHLWGWYRICTCHSVDTASRKAIHKGSGMRSRDSITERLAEWFEATIDKVAREQVLFLYWTLHSRNEAVCVIGLAM